MAGISGRPHRTTGQISSPPVDRPSLTEARPPPRKTRSAAVRGCPAPLVNTTEVLMTVSTIARPRGRPGYSATMPCSAESAEPARKLVRTALAPGVWGASKKTASWSSRSWSPTQPSTPRAPASGSPSPAPHTISYGSTCGQVTALPVLRKTGAYDTRGRGLALVAALTDRWAPIGCRGASGSGAS